MGDSLCGLTALNFPFLWVGLLNLFSTGTFTLLSRDNMHLKFKITYYSVH